MPQNEVPTINGIIHSSAECSLSVAAHGGAKPYRTTGIVDFSFKEKLTPEDVIVLGGQKVGTTEGVYAAEGSLTLLLASQVALFAALAVIAKAQRIKLGAVAFGIQGSFRRTISAPLTRFAASGVRFTEQSIEGSSNASAIQVPLPLNITQLRINGLSLGEVPR